MLFAWLLGGDSGEVTRREPSRVDGGVRSRAAASGTGAEGPGATLLARERREVQRRPRAAERPPAEREPQGPPSPEEQEAKRCASAVGGSCGFLDPSGEELLEMARCGTVKTDAPSSLLGSDEAPTLPASLLMDASVTPEEEATIRGVLGRVRDDSRAELRALFARRGVEVSDETTLPQMMLLMRTRLDSSAVEAAQREVAKERAGQEPRGAAPSDEERIVRALLGLGDRLERELATELGGERARELRIAHDGWEARMVSSLECEDER